MMRRPIILIVVHLCASALFAQVLDPEKEKQFQEKAAKVDQDTVYGWHHSLVSGLNLTQVSFKDWSQGGENALSYTVWGEGNSVHNQEMTNWRNAYRLAFGQTRLGNQGLRKTEDEIYFESLLIYKLGVYVNPYVSATMRTQFATGYKYEDDGTRTAVAQFFDPAYLTQSAGVAYKPFPELTTRLGVGLREIVTSKFTSYADDPTTPKVEKVMVDGGLESVTDVSWQVDDNLLLTSKLELFGPFNQLDRITARNNTTVAAKVNQYVTVNLNVQLINDVRVTPRTQIKETLSIGLSYTLM
jgi:hypothetical protein